MNKINPFFSDMHVSLQTHNIYENVTIFTQICNKDKCYFTSISNTWYMITIPNMTTNTIFFPEIS